LQNQRSQRALAALILEWLGNGHGWRTTPASGRTFWLRIPTDTMDALVWDNAGLKAISNLWSVFCRPSSMPARPPAQEVKRPAAAPPREPQRTARQLVPVRRWAAVRSLHQNQSVVSLMSDPLTRYSVPL
jgi:hypothetical protein